MDQNQTGSKCPCPHHFMVPVFITLFGLVFLLNAFGVISDQARDIAWPIIVILVGLQKMLERKCKCC